jgi:hypothetical protein
LEISPIGSDFSPVGFVDAASEEQPVEAGFAGDPLFGGVTMTGSLRRGMVAMSVPFRVPPRRRNLNRVGFELERVLTENGFPCGPRLDGALRAEELLDRGAIRRHGNGLPSD